MCADFGLGKQRICACKNVSLFTTAIAPPKMTQGTGRHLQHDVQPLVKRHMARFYKAAADYKLVNSRQSGLSILALELFDVSLHISGFSGLKSAGSKPSHALVRCDSTSLRSDSASGFNGSSGFLLQWKV